MTAGAVASSWIALQAGVGAWGCWRGFISAFSPSIKSFRFPASDQYLLKNFDIGTLGVLGLCFASAALSAVCWACRRLWAPSWAGLAVGHSTLRRGALTHGAA